MMKYEGSLYTCLEYFCKYLKEFARFENAKKYLNSRRYQN